VWGGFAWGGKKSSNRKERRKDASAQNVAGRKKIKRENRFKSPGATHTPEGKRGAKTRLRKENQKGKGNF